MLIPQEAIADKILAIRGRKVILDRDLARLYAVTTGNLNKAVKRNVERFPEDFMFQLTKKEADSLRFQFGSLKRGQHLKYLPYAFTEHGILMLSSVLQSERAVQVNIVIMRVFVRFREILSGHKELAQRITELEEKMGNKDKEIQAIFETIRQLMFRPKNTNRKIGFHSRED